MNAQQNYDATTRYLQRPGGRVAYDLSGDSGPLVIAAPGMGDLRQEYRFLAPKLVEAGFRVATMDLRGHGDTDVSWPDYSPEAVGGDMVALIEELGGGPATILGNSWAGSSAVWAAAERPDLVSGIVGLGPVVQATPLTFVQKLMMKTLLMRPWGPAAWGWYYKSLYPSQPPEDLADHIRAVKSKLKESGRFKAFMTLSGTSKVGTEALLEKVSVPALVIMGTKDPDFKDPEEEARTVAERLHGRYMMVVGAGHYPHTEMPEVVAPDIVAFVKSHGISGAASDAA